MYPLSSPNNSSSSAVRDFAKATQATGQNLDNLNEITDQVTQQIVQTASRNKEEYTVLLDRIGKGKTISKEVQKILEDITGPDGRIDPAKKANLERHVRNLSKIFNNMEGIVSPSLTAQQAAQQVLSQMIAGEGKDLGPLPPGSAPA